MDPSSTISSCNISAEAGTDIWRKPPNVNIFNGTPITFPFLPGPYTPPHKRLWLTHPQPPTKPSIAGP